MACYDVDCTVETAVETTTKESANMKTLRNLRTKMIAVTALASLLLAVLAGSAKAAVIYTLADGSVFDGGTTGVVGATASITDPITGITANLTTYDIIGNTASGLTSAKDDGHNHRTNIFSTNIGMGIASVSELGSNQNFDHGEAWQFTFDRNVIFNAIKTRSVDAGVDEMTLTIFDGSNGGAGYSVSLANGDNLGINYFVPSGTVLEVAVSSTTLGTNLNSLTVSIIPEPSVAMLLAIGFGLVGMKRRRRNSR